MKYNKSPFMYTERQMERRIRKLRPRLRRFEGVDLVITHAPVYGYGDMDDLPHTGFDCFNDLLDKYHPMYLLHGHVHQEYGNFERKHIHKSGTEIINCYGSYLLDIPEEKMPKFSEKAQRWMKIARYFDQRKGLY